MLIHPALVGLTFRQTLSRRRWLLLAVLAALPVITAIAVRGYAQADEDAVGMVVGGLSTLVLTGVVPIIALILSNAALGSEIDDGTVTYLLTKPLPRWQIVTSKLLTTALLAMGCAGLSTLCAAAIAMRGFDATHLVLGFTLAAMAGSVLYTAIFLALSLITRRGMLVGLIYLIVWEGALSTFFAGMRVLSVRQYMLSIADAVSTVTAEEFTAPLAVTTAYEMSLLVFVAATALCISRLRQFEIGQAN